MHSEKTHLALIDIRDCILLARQFTKGFSCETFKESRLHFFAVTRALEIISEASRKLPDSLRERHPALPWHAIRDAGNVYRHGYDNIVEAIVWTTVQEDLPSLLAVVVAELEAFKAKP